MLNYFSGQFFLLTNAKLCLYLVLPILANLALLLFPKLKSLTFKVVFLANTTHGSCFYRGQAGHFYFYGALKMHHVTLRAV